MTSPSFTIAIILFVAGCGRINFDAHDVPPADLPEGVSSGTRLRARQWVGEDGARAFETLYDTLLGTPCIFSPLEGKGRCVPDYLASVVPYFADPACTIPAARMLLAGCERPTYGYDLESRYFRLGAALATGYRWTGSACVQEVGDFYEIGAELALDELVAATLDVVPSGGRFAYEQWNADDGTRFMTGTLFDTVLGAPCTVETDLGQADPVCGPPVLYELYLDTACTNKVYGGFGPAISAGTMFSSERGPGDDNGLCKPRSYHVAAGVGQSDVFYFRDDVGGCGSVMLSGWYVESGATVERAMFPPGRFEPVEGRLGHRVWRSADGQLVPIRREYAASWVVWDRSLELYCAPGFDETGARRCLPEPLGGDLVWLDATCSTNAKVVRWRCDSAAPPISRVGVPGSTCRIGHDRVQRSVTHVGPAYSISTCAQLPADTWIDPNGDPGAITIDPATLSTVTTVID